MPSPGMRGWYVELDEELVKLFEDLYPDIGAKTLVTSLAIIEAIKSRSFQPLEGDYVSRNEG